MSALLIIAIALGALLLIGLATSKELIVQRAVVINRPLKEVFDFLRLVKNFDQFSIWAMMGPERQKVYRGNDGEEGFVYTWDSTQSAGEHEIKKLDEYRSILHEVRFFRPFKGVSTGKIDFEELSPETTRITWGYYGDMAFPTNILKPLMRKRLGGEMERSLQNLKALLEKEEAISPS